LIGFFVNTILLRTNLCGNPTFQQVLQRVRETALAAYDHQDLPFEDLVRTLERERNVKRTSLCQVMFIWQYTLPAPPQLPDLTLSVLEMDDNVGGPGWTATAFDIVFTLSENPQGLTGSCIYKTALFDPPTITRMLQDFQDVLEGLVSQPEQPISIFNALRHERG
jgi:non-ribosomal peptide synthetase component F